MLPIVLNKPVKMLKAEIIVPKNQLRDTIKLLQSIGVIQITKASEKEIEKYLKEYEEARHALEIIDSILSRKRGKVYLVNLTPMDIEDLSISKIYSDVNKIYTEIQVLEDNLRSELTRLDEVKEYLRILSLLPQDYLVNNLQYEGKHYIASTYYGRTESVEQFISDAKPIVLLKISREGLGIVNCVVKKTVYHKTRDIALNYGLSYLSLSKYIRDNTRTVKDLINKLSRLAGEAESRINELKEEIDKIIEENGEYLAKYKVVLENIIERLEALIKSLSTKYMTILRGWVPVKYKQKLLDTFRKNNIAAYVEFREPGEHEQPPTMLDNPRIIRWFEPIVKFLGVPDYREWDPTPIIAYSFALFFGIMLGDMGYAIAIILAALYILDKFTNDPENKDYVYFKNSIIVSSIVGFVIGALGGSFFGNTLKIFGLGFQFTDIFIDPLKFLALAIIIGLIHVNLAHAITLAKAIKHRQIGDALNEIGLFIGEAFGIPYIVYKVLNTPIPGIPPYIYNYLLYGAFVGIALIVIGTIKNLGGLGLLMWLFSITGLLGDVLSYSRLAGVGLATLYLASSFNLLAQMALGGIQSSLPSLVGLIVGGIVALMIAAFGHILNTALSALGGFIHSIRLCFVEFLSKFYEGTGYPFEPMKIVLRKRVVIE